MACGRASDPRLPRAGKAAWIAGTTFLVLVVPLIIEMDREQQVRDGGSDARGRSARAQRPPPPHPPRAQLVEFETQQLGALTAPAAGSSK